MISQTFRLKTVLEIETHARISYIPDPEGFQSFPIWEIQFPLPVGADCSSVGKEEEGSSVGYAGDSPRENREAHLWGIVC